MILSNKHHIFGSKVAIIQNRSFTCTISTAKESLLGKQSSMIMDGDYVRDREHTRVCAKLIYASSLSSRDRLSLHDSLATQIDKLGESGTSFQESVQSILAEFKQRGIFSETINLA